MRKFAYTASQCHQLDALALKQLKLSEIQLMNRAAVSLYSALETHWPEARKISVYCGPGNNGGDGYLLAVKANQAGRQVRIFALSKPKSIAARAAMNLAIHQNIRLNFIDQNPAESIDAHADLRVDALFGMGLKRPIQAPLTNLIEHLNAAPVPIFSVDVPSGINSDTGAVMGTAIHATRTHSVVARKPGLYTGDAPDFTGNIGHDDLAIPDGVFSTLSPNYVLLDGADLRKILPDAPITSHKGDFGHIAVVGGQPGMLGAIILAASAAARSGAGRVTVHSFDTHINAIAQANPVLMTRAIMDNGRLRFPKTTNAVVLGPGLGIKARLKPSRRRKNWSKQVFLTTIKFTSEKALPMVLDADGLNLLALLGGHYSKWVLCPHPKEAARLLHCQVSEIQKNRAKACRLIAKKYGGVCVLKGKGTLISAADGLVAICPLGNWGMATAGSGDVLSGIVGAFLGLGLKPYPAACAAVWVHSRAGDIVAQKTSKRSMIASDIIDALPQVFRAFEKC